MVPCISPKGGRHAPSICNGVDPDPTAWTSSGLTDALTDHHESLKSCQIWTFPVDAPTVTVEKEQLKNNSPAL